MSATKKNRREKGRKEREAAAGEFLDGRFLAHHRRADGSGLFLTPEGVFGVMPRKGVVAQLQLDAEAAAGLARGIARWTLARSEAKLRERVLDTLERGIGVPRAGLVDAANFVADLGCDSLDVMELVMEIEREFGMDIPDKDAAQIATVGDAVRYVVGRRFA